MTPETKAAIRECAQLVCPRCRLKWISVKVRGEWKHGSLDRIDALECWASAIRARFPEAFEEAE